MGIIKFKNNNGCLEACSGGRLLIRGYSWKISPSEEFDPAVGYHGTDFHPSEGEYLQDGSKPEAIRERRKFSHTNKE